MNDIKSLKDVHDVLAEHGYKPTLNETTVSVPIGSEENPFPCVIAMDDTYLTVDCYVGTYGSIMSISPEGEREDFLLGMLDLNSRMNSYAITVMSDIDDPDASEDKSEWPMSLHNKMPVGDLSTEELLESMRGLLSALQTAASLFTVSVVESL